MNIADQVQRVGPVLRDAVASGDLRTLKTLLGPAYRGLLQRRGRRPAGTEVATETTAFFDWAYARQEPQLARLYEAAKTSQWNASTDLDWSQDVDPRNPERLLLPLEIMPVSSLASFRALPLEEKAAQNHKLVAWMLSQFLHGEQGALYAACQVTQAVPWTDAKLYGSSQVVDEGRHVEVFHTYLSRKLEKVYLIDDNLYVVIDALMSDGRWDLKFLGMQILIEGLALGAFGFLRMATREPLLKQLLTYVITDEARHVHYGVLALEKFYREGLPERARREREDWALEVCLLLRNRFLSHEFYDEHYAHEMSRKAWDQMVLGSEMMRVFRATMFKRIIPNLKRIGLLSERVRGHYDRAGLLAFVDGKAAPELTARDLLEEG